MIMPKTHDIAHLGVTQANDEATHGLGDQTRSEPQLSETNSTTDWRPAFDKKVERLMANNQRTREICSWRDPIRSLYQSKLPDPLVSSEESCDRESPKQMSSDQGVDQPSSETSIECEAASTTLILQSNGENVCATHDESEDALLPSAEKDLDPKHIWQDVGTVPKANENGDDGESRQPMTEPSQAADGSWSCTAEAVDAARLRVISLVDAFHSPEYDADDEAYGRHEEAPDEDEAAPSEMLTHVVKSAIELSDEQREAMVTPNEDRIFVAGLVQKGITRGIGVLDTEISRRSSAVPSLETDNGSIATDNTEYGLFCQQVSFRVKAAIAWWDESSRKARQSTTDSENSGSEYSVVEDANSAVSKSKGEKKVHFDAEAMQGPEDGPHLTMRNSEDREVILAQMGTRGFKAELDKLLESKTIQQLGARTRKFVELQQTHGIAEADAYLKREDVEEDGPLEGDKEDDGNILQKRCLEFNLKDMQSEVPRSGTRLRYERGDEDEQQPEDETTTETGRKRLFGIFCNIPLPRTRFLRSHVSVSSSSALGSSSVTKPAPSAPPRPWRAPEWI